MTEIGPHLLGRIPSPPDSRDYHLENFVGLGRRASRNVLRAPASPHDLALAAREALKRTTITYPRWAATTYPDVTATNWWRALNDLNLIIGVAPPPAPAGDVEWLNREAVLDQGDYGTCVGNGAAQWGNTEPYNDRWDEKIARAIYYEATVLDGAPDDPDAPNGGQQGATVRSGMKALKSRGRLSTYAVTTSVDTVRAWLQAHGPVVFGSEWTKAMFSPSADGYVTPSGTVEGGHCYVATGDLAAEGAIKFLNSWGPGWTLGGYFKMKLADVATLLAAQGEAWTAPELAI